MPAEVASGPTMLRVGDRSPKDKKFAPDEYVYADPGVGGTVVVAPRPRGETPTMKNAIKAVLKQRGRKRGGVSMPQEGLREMATRRLFGESTPHKAAEGINITDPSVFQGSALLNALMGALGGQAETFAVGVPQVQQQLFGLLGQIIPGMLGLTDPAEQRRALGAPQYFRDPRTGGIYTQMPTGEFRVVSDPDVAKSLGITKTTEVGPGFVAEMGSRGLGPRITAADVPAVLAAFKQPTLGAQQLRTQRELRGLSGVPGASQIPRFGI